VISRILSHLTGGGNYLSRLSITEKLKRSTRRACKVTSFVCLSAEAPPIWSCSGCGLHCRPDWNDLL